MMLFEESYVICRLPENKMKNRYLDVLCLEESRVKLNDLDGNTVSCMYFNLCFCCCNCCTVFC